MANDCNDLNNFAMYYSICEYLAEFAEMTYEEEMPDELWEYLVERAFQYEGVDNIDVKAVGKLFNECMAAGEQLADLQGYAIPSGYPFDDWCRGVLLAVQVGSVLSECPHYLRCLFSMSFCLKIIQLGIVSHCTASNNLKISDAVIADIA